MVNCFFLFLLEGKHSVEKEGVISWGKIIKLRKKGCSHKAIVVQNLEKVVVVVKIVHDSFLFLAAIRSQRDDIFLPFQDEFKSVHGELGEVVEAIRKKLQFSFTELPLFSGLTHFQFVALVPVLLSFVFATFVEESLLSDVEVLIDVILVKICQHFLELSKARLTRVNGLEYAVV